MKQPRKGTISQSVMPFTLRQNVSWIFIGNLIYAGSQWGMLIIMAKLASAEMVGKFALAAAICNPIFMLTNLQLRNIQATDAKDEYSFNDYLSLRVITSSLAWLIIAGVMLLVGYRIEVFLITMGLGVAKGFESLSDVAYGKVQKHERMDRIAISMLIKGMASLLVWGTLIWLTHSLLAGIIGLVGVWFSVMIIYDLNNAQQMSGMPVRLHAHRPILWRLVKYALPLGITMMLASLNVSIPRYFIERFLGEKYLGYFSAMSYVMVAGTIIVSALGQAAIPRLSKYYATGNIRAFRRLIGQLLGLAALLGLLCVFLVLLFGREVLSILYRPDYAEYSYVFVWIAIAAAFDYMSTILGHVMTSAHYFRVQAPLFFFVVVVMCSTSALIIPSWGLLGAAKAVTIAAFIRWLASLLVNLRIISATTEKRWFSANSKSKKT